MKHIYIWEVENCKTGSVKTARASSVRALVIRYYGDRKMSIDVKDTDEAGGPTKAFICKGSSKSKEARVLLVTRVGDSEVIKNTKERISSARTHVGNARTRVNNARSRVSNRIANAKANAKARKASKGTAPSKPAPPEKKRSEPEDDDWDEDEYDVY